MVTNNKTNSEYSTRAAHRRTVVVTGAFAVLGSALMYFVNPWFAWLIILAGAWLILQTDRAAN